MATTVINNKTLNEKLAKANISGIVLSKVEDIESQTTYFQFTYNGISDDSFVVDVKTFKSMTPAQWVKTISEKVNEYNAKTQEEESQEETEAITVLTTEQFLNMGNTTETEEEPTETQVETVEAQEVPAEPEKPVKKEKKVKEPKKTSLEDIKKLAGRMYQKFEPRAFDPDGHGNAICVLLRHKDCEDYYIYITINKDGKVNLTVPNLTNINPECKNTIDFILRLSYLLQDKSRQKKLTDIVARYFLENA